MADLPFFVRAGLKALVQTARHARDRTKLVLAQTGGLAPRQGEDRKGEAQVRLARIYSSRLHVYLLGSVEQAWPDY